MKKIIYLLLVSLIVFSCEKAKIENEFDQSPEQRTQVKIDELNSKLLSNQKGWYTEYKHDNNKKVKPLFFNFKDKNRVVIKSHINGFESKETSYTLSYTENVDMIFNTNNVLAHFVERMEGADFRWQLVSLKEDEIIFKSKEQRLDKGSTLILRKSDGSHANTLDKLAKLIPKLSHDLVESYFRNLEIKGVKRRYAFSFEKESLVLTFESENEQGNREVHTSKMLNISEDKFSLTNPLYVNGIEIKDFAYDSANKKFIIENSSLKGEIVYGSKVLTYKGAADAFLAPRKVHLIQKEPSHRYKPFVDAIFKIKGVSQIQWYVFTKNVSRDGINIFIEDGSNRRWVGNDVATRMQKGGEDIIIVPRAGNTDLSGAFSGDSKKAIDDHFLLCSESEGFYVINNQKRNSKGEETYTLVSKKSPNIFFKLTTKR